MSETYPILTRCWPIRQAKLKEAEDIIFILWRGLAVYKVCDSCGMNINNLIAPCYEDYQVENTFLF